MLRARELAEKAGVSLPTIKHYVNEGLIPKPHKTGKTMAYYEEACVDRIKLIKKLQKERFLPLDVIKRILDSGAAYEEELELGEAILKSKKLQSEEQPLSEAGIERRTGYPLKKIRLLEKEGIILPTQKNEGKYYDSIDCKIIEIMKSREKLGLPFEHSVQTIKLYRDAIANAVRDDIRLFARNLLGDFSTRQTVKLLTEADDLLNSFVVLIRQKMQRSFSQTALRQMNDLAAKLRLLFFVPLEGTELPVEHPEKPELRLIYFLCAGACDSAISLVDTLSARRQNNRRFAAAAVIAHILKDEPDTALRIVDQHMPKPTARTLDNVAAALACMFSAGKASGFSGPMYLAKRGLGYLKRAEAACDGDELADILASYACGSVYTILPDVFDTAETGIEMLVRVDYVLKKKKLKTGRLPAWLKRTLEYEILPAMEVRVSRFLAEVCLSDQDYEAAMEYLKRVVLIADVDSEHAKWANLKRLEIRNAAGASRRGGR